MESIITNKESEMSKEIINKLREKSEYLHLLNSVLYYNYPFFLDDEGELIESKILIISKYGIFIIWVIDELEIDNDSVLEINETIEQLTYTIQSKLMINRTLRKFNKEVVEYVTSPIIYAPLLRNNIPSEYSIFRNEETLISSLQQIIENSRELTELEYREIRATLEGSKPLIKKKRREITSETSKGKIISQL